ncbi:hypothetical protein T261_1567 [Streptomyces lydicus]|nr:hypothetical protein T261_1567 [Streptomyces lydicus]
MPVQHADQAFWGVCPRGELDQYPRIMPLIAELELHVTP